MQDDLESTVKRRIETLADTQILKELDRKVGIETKSRSSILTKNTVLESTPASENIQSTCNLLCILLEVIAHLIQFDFIIFN